MKLSVLVLTGVILFATGCDQRRGSGRIVTEKRNVSAFSKLSASSGLNVEVRKGSTHDVTVEADDNIIGLIETTVEDGRLILKIKDHTNLSDTYTSIFLTVPQLSEIKASSGSNVEVKDQLTYSGVISFDASSAGHITTSVDAPTISAEASSGAELEISGRTKDFKARSSSGSSIKAFELYTENAVAEASSGASVNTRPSVSLEGNASSGGNINYRGGAPSIKKQESSGGNISKED